MSGTRRPDDLKKPPAKSRTSTRETSGAGPLSSSGVGGSSGAGSPSRQRRSPEPRGPYSGALGTFSRNRAPIAIGDLLERTLGSPKLKGKAEEYAAFPLWPEIVGATIAETAKPLKIISGNVLVVQVIDASWAQELSMQKEDLLQKIHHRNVGAVIQDLKFVTGNPKRFSGR